MRLYLVRFFLNLVVAPAALLVLVACQSTSGPGSASFASVTINKHTPEQIHAATGAVFREDGYAGAQMSPTQMLFEKEASRLSTISREGLIAAQGGARTIERVRTELVDLGGGTYRLQCQAYMVMGGPGLFEDEKKLSNLRAVPYQILLNQVESKLK